MSRIRIVVFGVTAMIVAASCARTRLVIEPLRGQTADQLDRDRWECGLSAQEQTGFDPARSTTTGALIGGLAGAAGGAAIGSAIGAGLATAGAGAALGAVAGGSAGASGGGVVGGARATSARDRAFDACLDARGYAVREEEVRR